MLAHALHGHRDLPRLWRDATPRDRYEVIVVGGGGHGLATAYYLAKNHHITNVAVIEKGWIGGGNSGRNTSIVRSNYLHPASIAFYDRSLTLFENLTRELNFNILFSRRGVLNLANSRAALNAMRRRVTVLRHHGVDAQLLGVAEIAGMAPALRLHTPTNRVVGGFVQPRGGIARHDAVVWGYARAADALGVDVVQRCGVDRLLVENGTAKGVEIGGRRISADAVVVATAGHSTALLAPLGLRLPLTNMALQAMVTEPVKPFLNVVVDGAVYVSQSDRGELVVGGGTDSFASHARRGSGATAGRNFAALLDLLPQIGRLRLMRQWAGTVDYPPDHSPIIGPTPIANLFLTAGWGSYGFKAIPAGGECLAHTIATGRVHPLIEAFALDRFRTGRLVREAESSGMDLEGAVL
jgi:sarcosine oxidase, subunit beta